MPVHIFVPRWMDHTNLNAQNSNAQALLSRFSDPRARWTAIFTDEPSEVIRRSGIETRHLSRAHWWQCELALAYQSRVDAIFYPGPHWGDEFGLNVRRFSGRRAPVIATIEGLIAAPEAVRQISEWRGHPVFSQPGVDSAIPRIRRIYQQADHIIAISPFLAQVAKFLYGDKISWLPFGVEASVFNSVEPREELPRCRIVGCGTIKASKNPQVFLRLADCYKEADFVWFGEGMMRQELIAKQGQCAFRIFSFRGRFSLERWQRNFVILPYL